MKTAQTTRKTRQTGVRFDIDMLQEMKELQIALSPQRALNWLTSFYKIQTEENILLVDKEIVNSKLKKDSRRVVKNKES